MAGPAWLTTAIRSDEYLAQDGVLARSALILVPPDRSFSSHQFKAKCTGERAGNLALKSEQIASVVVERLRPDMRVGRGIDQLGAVADLATGPPDAAFEHITYA